MSEPFPSQTDPREHLAKPGEDLDYSSASGEVQDEQVVLTYDDITLLQQDAYRRQADKIGKQAERAGEDPKARIHDQLDKPHSRADTYLSRLDERAPDTLTPEAIAASMDDKWVDRQRLTQAEEFQLYELQSYWDGLALDPGMARARVEQLRKEAAAQRAAEAQQPEQPQTEAPRFDEEEIRRLREQNERMFNNGRDKRGEQSAGTPEPTLDDQQAEAHNARGQVERIHASEQLRGEIVNRYTDNSVVLINARSGFKRSQGDKYQDLSDDVSFSGAVMDALPNQITSVRNAKEATEVPVETVVFRDVETPVYKETVITPAKPAGMFKAAQLAQIRREQVGTDRVYGVNQETGQQEPLTAVCYTFHIPNRSGYVYDLPGMPSYRETGGLRDGNMLQIQLQLPESVAARLRAEINDNPDALRTIADQMVLKTYAGNKDQMNDEIWFKGETQQGADGPVTLSRARPPYEDLPDGWQLHIVEPARAGEQPLSIDDRQNGATYFSGMKHSAVAAPAQRKHR